MINTQRPNSEQTPLWEFVHSEFTSEGQWSNVSTVHWAVNWERFQPEILSLSSSVGQRTLACSKRRDLLRATWTFLRALFKIGQCSLKEAHKDRERER